ncbi:hypothetical protein F4604DRAFT_1755386 [Suillus subluteus]|nr:hypothetical protein F4604DRAFT_1755386 [Suillus subluteus]
MSPTDYHALMVAVWATFTALSILILHAGGLVPAADIKLTLYDLTRMSKKAPAHKSRGHSDIVCNTHLTSNLP